MNRAFIFLVGICLLLISCQHNPFDIDLEEKIADFEFIRLDQEVFRSELDDPIVRQEHLLETYPEFYPQYFERILRIGPSDDSLACINFNEISKQVVFSDTQMQIDSVFFLDQKIREDFNSAFCYYQHYFPNRIIPDVIAMNTGFNYGVYPLEGYLGVGLEFYLGQDNRITKGLPIANFPNYQKAKMDPKYLLSDALRGYLLSVNQGMIQGDKLINHIIYQGKVMYVLNAILPFEEEHLQMGYTREQLDWCERNEFNVWKAIIDEDLVYSADHKQIERFIGFGPFTQGFPQESPGMIGLFIGKRIVFDYMDKNPDTSLEDLFRLNDLKILNKYKPDK